MDRIAAIKSMIRRTVGDFAADLASCRVFFFGSRVTGQAKQLSDFDIGIDSSAPLAPSVRSRLADALEALPTLYKIDLVDFSSASPKFREYALAHTEDIL